MIVRTKSLFSDEYLSHWHVLAVVSNPIRYRSRYRLYRDFEQRMQCAGVKLWTVEQAFGDREHSCTEPTDPFDVQIRTFDELWHKEQMFEIGLQRIATTDPKYEGVMTIDADVMFHRPDWFLETVHQLQHYMVVQMFSYAVDLGPKYEPLQMHKGYVKAYLDGDRLPTASDGYGYDGYGKLKGAVAHPGFAWGYRREVLEKTGFITWAILGSADHNQARGWLGRIEDSFPSNVSSRYAKKMLLWQERALEHGKKDIGYVDTLISHYWHGKKRDRGYVSRWSILTENGFDPDVDLQRDTQGLWTLTDRNIKLRDDIRRYLRSRNEDSTDV